MDVPPDDTGSARRRIPDDAVIDRTPARDGWMIRRLRLPAKGPARGSILFAGGRGDFVEKYLESLCHWRDLGWNVESFDWRGQGMSGRIVEGSNIGHADSFDPWLADLEVLAADWRHRSPGPYILAGHSTGGHLVLRRLSQAPDSADGGIVIAPLLGLGRGLVGDGLIRRIADWQVARGRGSRPAWGQARPGTEARRRLSLTACPERFPDEGWWWRQQPEFQLGGASWGWISAAMKSIRELTRPGVLEHLTTPLLLLCAEDDPVVSSEAVRRMLPRLPNARARFFAGARHELLREADAIRLPVWAEIDAFIDGIAAR